MHHPPRRRFATGRLAAYQERADLADTSSWLIADGPHWVLGRVAGSSTRQPEQRAGSVARALVGISATNGRVGDDHGCAVDVERFAAARHQTHQPDVWVVHTLWKPSIRRLPGRSGINGCNKPSTLSRMGSRGMPCCSTRQGRDHSHHRLGPLCRRRSPPGALAEGPRERGSRTDGEAGPATMIMIGMTAPSIGL